MQRKAASSCLPWASGVLLWLRHVNGLRHGRAARLVHTESHGISGLERRQMIFSRFKVLVREKIDLGRPEKVLLMR